MWPLVLSFGKPCHLGAYNAQFLYRMFCRRRHRSRGRRDTRYGRPEIGQGRVLHVGGSIIETAKRRPRGGAVVYARSRELSLPLLRKQEGLRFEPDEDSAD